jgi:hypothetical protein
MVGYTEVIQKRRSRRSMVVYAHRTSGPSLGDSYSVRNAESLYEGGLIQGRTRAFSGSPFTGSFPPELFVGKLLLADSGDHTSWIFVDRVKLRSAMDNHKIDLVCKLLAAGRYRECH